MGGRGERSRVRGRVGIAWGRPASGLALGRRRLAKLALGLGLHVHGARGLSRARERGSPEGETRAGAEHHPEQVGNALVHDFPRDAGAARRRDEGADRRLQTEEMGREPSLGGEVGGRERPPGGGGGRGHSGARGHREPEGGRGRSLFGEEAPLDCGRGLFLVTGISSIFQISP